MNSHGWVIPNPDGSVARCGGPGVCKVCQAEKGSIALNDTKVVRYEPWCTENTAFMETDEEGTYVTHADYRALEEELAALRVRVGSLVDASTYARRELQSCQSVIHLHGGFDPAYVEGAQKAMRGLSAALEDLK